MTLEAECAISGLVDGCLDETGALAFVAGEISAAARAAIEDHVDTCAECRTLLATMLQSELADPFAPGRRVGHYVVRERIGRGATGVVYRADDLELYRPVALKRLAGHSRADRDATARLVREARAAAQLSHPNVVTIYEVGDADGEAFIAMEFVDGVTLAAWRRAGVRRWRDVVDVFAQAGQGLAAAHANGLVHRDFKPDNVLIDPSGRARVADFGLARSASGTAGPPLPPLTASGVVVGTPAYLAPEVIENGVHDARSDQYAFAASLYEALHGRLPLHRGGRVEREIRVPRWLEARIARGLAAEPSERWPDVAAMIDAITRPPRWRVVVSLIGATAIAIVAIVGIAFGNCRG
jgi:serine/threonine protein kinase